MQLNSHIGNQQYHNNLILHPDNTDFRRVCLPISKLQRQSDFSSPYIFPKNKDYPLARCQQVFGLNVNRRELGFAISDGKTDIAKATLACSNASTNSQYLVSCMLKGQWLQYSCLYITMIRLEQSDEQ
jgi:hypothetical protein